MGFVSVLNFSRRRITDQSKTVTICANGTGYLSESCYSDNNNPPTGVIAEVDIDNLKARFKFCHDESLPAGAQKLKGARQRSFTVTVAVAREFLKDKPKITFKLEDGENDWLYTNGESVTK